MTILETDKSALDIMRSWNLDLMEKVLELYTKEDFIYPLWYLHPPIEAEGFVEALTALCDQNHDTFETCWFLEDLSLNPNAKSILSKLLATRRKEEREHGLSNILIHNHLKLMKWTEENMSGVDHFLTLDEHRKETYSSPDVLKIYFKDE
jgi:hypothetical protein